MDTRFKRPVRSAARVIPSRAVRCVIPRRPVLRHRFWRRLPALELVHRSRARSRRRIIPTSGIRTARWPRLTQHRARRATIAPNVWIVIGAIPHPVHPAITRWDSSSDTRLLPTLAKRPARNATIRDRSARLVTRRPVSSRRDSFAAPASTMPIAHSSWAMDLRHA